MDVWDYNFNILVLHFQYENTGVAKILVQYLYFSKNITVKNKSRDQRSRLNEIYKKRRSTMTYKSSSITPKKESG